MLDLSHTYPAIRSGLIYRSKAEDTDPLPHGSVRVELRVQTELDAKRTPYPREPHLWIPMEVPPDGHGGLTRMEYAYRGWIDVGATIFPPILRTACSGKGLAIGCQQGIDRTGFVCAVLHLLCGTPRDAILAEYLRCGNHTTIPHHLDLCLDAIAAAGGVESYLTGMARCDLSSLYGFRSATLT
jgi:hypothetical protein